MIFKNFNFFNIKKKKIFIETSLGYKKAIKVLETIDLNNCSVINKIPPIKNKKR